MCLRTNIVEILCTETLCRFNRLRETMPVSAAIRKLTDELLVTYSGVSDAQIADHLQRAIPNYA